MPFILIVIGVFFIIAAARNTQGELYTLLQGDFVGPNNFFYWFLAIMVIGGLGYIKPLKPISHGFLALVLLGLFLGHGQANKGFFDQFQSQIQQFAAITPMPISYASSPGDVGSEPAAPASGGGAGGIFGTLLNVGLGLIGL